MENTGNGSTGPSQTSTFKNFASGIANSKGFLSFASLAAGVLNETIPTPRENLNSTNKAMADTRGTISLALISSGNPYAMAAGAVVMAIDKTGGFSDGSKGLGKSTDAANVISSFALPGAGYFLKKTDSYTMSEDMKSMASGYAGSIKDGLTAMGNARAKLLFGRDKANRMIREAKRRDYIISGIKKDASDDLAAALTGAQTNAIAESYALSGGYDLALARAAKKGGLLNRIDKAKETRKRIKAKADLLNSASIHKDLLSDMGTRGGAKTVDDIEKLQKVGVIESKELGGDFEFYIEPYSTVEDYSDFFNEVPEFQKGGQMNVIPEGALHARKHNMEDAEDLTKKGIPVIDNEGNLQAEIEVNEIIFNKEVSTKLEELWKKYKEDKKDAYAVLAGKLIAKEIMENTDDRTGLLKEGEDEVVS